MSRTARHSNEIKKNRRYEYSYDEELEVTEKLEIIKENDMKSYQLRKLNHLKNIDLYTNLNKKFTFDLMESYKRASELKNIKPKTTNNSVHSQNDNYGINLAEERGNNKQKTVTEHHPSKNTNSIVTTKSELPAIIVNSPQENEIKTTNTQQGSKDFFLTNFLSGSSSPVSHPKLKLIKQSNLFEELKQQQQGGSRSPKSKSKENSKVMAIKNKKNIKITYNKKNKQIKSIRGRTSLNVSTEDELLNHIPAFDNKNDLFMDFRTESDLSKDHPLRSLLNTPPKRYDKRKRIFDEIYHIDDDYLKKIEKTKKLKKSLNLLDYQNQLVKIISTRMSIDNIKKLSLNLKEVREMADMAYPMNNVDWNDVAQQIIQAGAHKKKPLILPPIDIKAEIEKHNVNRSVRNSIPSNNTLNMTKNNFGSLKTQSKIIILPIESALTSPKSEQKLMSPQSDQKKYFKRKSISKADVTFSKMNNNLPEFLVEKFKNLKVHS